MASTSLTSFPRPEYVDCPYCKLAIKLLDPSGSEFCTCNHCQSFIQFIADKPVKLDNVRNFKLDIVIPLGTEGTLKDIPFKVIAVLEKDEHNPAYTWHEYLLYNYEKGYATLSEYQGHWNIIFGSNFLPALDEIEGDPICFEGLTYKLFNKYSPFLIAAKGEFDWNIYKDRLRIAEYIAPPFMISGETQKGKNEKTQYYRGEYLEPTVVAAAFGLDLELFPERQGVGANQASKAQLQWSWVLNTTLILMLAVFVIALLYLQFKPEKTIMAEHFELTYEPQKGANEFKSFRSPTFEVEEFSTALEMELSSSWVNNNWLEATVVLVNEANNKTWEVTKGIEYYEGVEDGERWSEGEHTTEVLLSEIPKGKYHLNIYPASGDWALNSMEVVIRANTILWRNVVIWLLALWIYPAFIFFRMRYFEQKRWMNSDYSPI